MRRTKDGSAKDGSMHRFSTTVARSFGTTASRTSEPSTARFGVLLTVGIASP
ncbi:MAG TPA: hypothetical protein VFO94_16815 [Gammaproteobacteria bacterium]|nr:hypothetical protein [Gammaproteobacteria bacterium]